MYSLKQPFLTLLEFFSIFFLFLKNIIIFLWNFYFHVLAIDFSSVFGTVDSSDKSNTSLNQSSVYILTWYYLLLSHCYLSFLLHLFFKVYPWVLIFPYPYYYSPFSVPKCLEIFQLSVIFECSNTVTITLSVLFYPHGDFLHSLPSPVVLFEPGTVSRPAYGPWMSSVWTTSFLFLGELPCSLKHIPEWLLKERFKGNKCFRVLAYLEVT